VAIRFTMSSYYTTCPMRRLKELYRDLLYTPVFSSYNYDPIYPVFTHVACAPLCRVCRALLSNRALEDRCGRISSVNRWCHYNTKYAYQNKITTWTCGDFQFEYLIVSLDFKLNNRKKVFILSDFITKIFLVIVLFYLSI